MIMLVYFVHKSADFEWYAKEVSHAPHASSSLLLTMASPLAAGASFSRLISPKPSAMKSRGAVLDRYTFIRSFFKQQMSTPQLRALPPWSTPLPFKVMQNFPRRHQHAVAQFNRRQFFHSTTKRTFPQLGQSTDKPPPNHDPPKPPDDAYRNTEDYSRFFRRLAMSLPHPHRPTREDFLNVSTGFWQRLRIRFKWFTIKSFRKFNADDMSAFITWFLMSQTLWILVGT
jgi:distribution and morphology protein 31